MEIYIQPHPYVTEQLLQAKIKEIFHAQDGSRPSSLNSSTTDGLLNECVEEEEYDLGEIHTESCVPCVPEPEYMREQRLKSHENNNSAISNFYGNVTIENSQTLMSHQERLTQIEHLQYINTWLLLSVFAFILLSSFCGRDK